MAKIRERSLGLGSQCAFTFLGTGAGEGVPIVGCDCDICYSVERSSFTERGWRTRSCALLDVGCKSILLDCGPDIRTQLLNVRTIRRLHSSLYSKTSPYSFSGQRESFSDTSNQEKESNGIETGAISEIFLPDEIDYVLLTHWNFDHVGGLIELNHTWRPDRLASKEKIELLLTEHAQQGYRSLEGSLFRTSAPDGTKRASEDVEDVFIYTVVEPYKCYKLFTEHIDERLAYSVEVIPIETYHTPDSVAFAIYITRYEDLGDETGDKNSNSLKESRKEIVYLTDSPYEMPEKTREIIKDSDLLIMDCTFYKNVEEKGFKYHMDTEDCIRLVRETNPKMAYVTHISHRNLEYDDLIDLFGDMRNLGVAYDGLRFELF